MVLLIAEVLVVFSLLAVLRIIVGVGARVGLLLVIGL